MHKLRLCSLKALINLSQDLEFVEQMCQLGTNKRVYEVLKENVRQDLKNAELESDEQATKLVAGEGVFELVKSAENDVQEATIEHCFLLLCNLSGHEIG